MTSQGEETEWPVNKVRQTFIAYFEERGHTFWRSSKVVPHDDPTLLFTNSGMNQFKPIFQGTVDPKSELGKLKRAANSQKCIRAGGKHNDLDDVGKDTYHHTFFEMLGNWSFGDYFKKEAIEWSWDLLTRVFGLDASRLYATYYGGNESAGIPADLEARDLWRQFLPDDRILPFEKENFWEMGETGPCGPCTEIHYDLLGGRVVPELVNADDPSLIEIWNNVFMQFNRENDGTLVTLPHKHVDTGMGLERIVCALQHKTSNYDTDVFRPLFSAIQTVTGMPAYGGRVDLSSPEGRLDMAYRVLADHTRCLAVALADGARPGPDGRDYVVRRILRRAIRYGMESMKAPAGFFAQLVDVVCASLGDAFPEVREQRAETVRIIQEEESSFGRTLARGSVKLAQMIDRLGKDGGDAPVLDRDSMFLLYDAFGFPPDLTEIMANERGVRVDRAGFDEKMARKRMEDKLAGKSLLYGGTGEESLMLKPEARDVLQSQRSLPPTDDSWKYDVVEIRSTSPTTFSASTTTVLSATIVALWSQGSLVDSVRGTGSMDDRFAVILDRTPFYAESGGQMGDMGELRSGANGHFEVQDAQRDGPYVLHMGYLTVQGLQLSVGQTVEARVDADRRFGLMRNHTGTHLLNHALRAVLGEGVEQKGSLVASDRLRFDYNAKEAPAPAQLDAVRDHVGTLIASALPVASKELPLETALAIPGIRAVFGETYPNPVRVVAVQADPTTFRPDGVAYPVELCGGTHLRNTAEAGHFVVLRDEALARGIRRLVGCTGPEALRAVEEGDRLEAEAARLETLPVGPERAEEMKLLSRELEAAAVPQVVASRVWAKLAALQSEGGKARVAEAKELRAKAVDEGKARAERAKAEGERFVVAHEPWFPCSNPVLVDYLKGLLDAGVPAMALASDDKKAMLIANVPADCLPGFNAVEWVKAAADCVEGKGGGSKDGRMGQAAGKNPSAIPLAIAAATEFARSKV